MKNKKKVSILTTLYFLVILLMIVILCNAKDFNILDIESSPQIYIVICFMLVISCFTTPLVIVFTAVVLKDKDTIR